MNRGARGDGVGVEQVPVQWKLGLHGPHLVEKG